MARCRNIELLQLGIDQPPVKKKLLGRQVVDTVGFPKCDVCYCFVQWEALRIEGNEAIHDRPPLNGLMQYRVLAKYDDFNLTVSDERIQQERHRFTPMKRIREVLPLDKGDIG
jgi:hypothetical protein